MSLLGNLTVGILGNMGGLSNTFSDAQNQVRQFGRQMQNIGSDLTSIGSTLTAAVTVPIVGLATASAKSAIEFESAFAGVRKTVDATEKEFEVLRKGILNMSREIPAAATEIAAVGEAAGQLGIKKENIMGFTRTMVDLGVATNMSSDEAATALARLANITQMNQKDFDKLGSTIVALGNNLATTESEIVAMGLRIAGAGAQVGLTEAQILSFAGALSSVGIEAEAGGTAFSRVMIDMSTAVQTGGKSLNNFAKVAGMSTTDFKKAFKEDAAGAIITFIEGLGKMSAEGKNVFGVLEDLGLSEIRVRDALLRASGAGDLFRESLETGTKAWDENIALTKEAEERYKTTESQLKILWNRIKLIGITIGDALLPAILSTIDAMQPFLDMLEKAAEWFKNLDPSIQAVVIAIGAIAAAIGPTLVMLGMMISSAGTLITAFSGLGGAIAQAGGLIGILTGPIGLTVAAIVGLGAALIAAWNHSETFRTTVTGIWESVKTTALNVFGVVSSFIQEKLGAIKTFWDENGAQFLAAVENVFNGIKAVIEFVMPAIKFIVEMVWTAIKQVISGALDVIMGLIKVFSGLFTGDFSKMWEGIKQIFFGAIDLIIGWMTLTFVGGLRTLLTNLAKLGVNLVKGMADGIVGLFRTFTTTGQNLAKGMVDAVLNFFRNLVDAAITLFKLFQARGASTFEAFKGVVLSILNSLKAGLQAIWNAIASLFTNTASTISNVVSGIFNGLKTSISNIWGSVKGVIEKIWNGVMDFFRGIDLTKIGKDIIQGLINGIGSMASAVWDKAKSIATGIGDSIKKTLDIHSPSRVMVEIGENVGEGLVIGISNTEKDLQIQMQKLTDIISSSNDKTTNLSKWQMSEMQKIAKLGYSDRYKAVEEWISKQYQLENITIEDEIKLWQYALKEFNFYSEDKKRASIKLRDAEQKAYDDMSKSLSELRDKKQKLYDDIKAAGEDYLKKTQEINQKMIEEEQKLTAEYEKAVVDRTRALTGFAGLFDEVKVKSEVTGGQLVANLQGQVEAFADWADDIASLASRGIDDGLLEELRQMGPKAASEIKALNSLTDEELAKYSNLWLEKNRLAKEQATAELEELRVETENKIDQLHSRTADQLEKLRIEWIEKMKGISSGTTNEFDILAASMPEIGENIIQGLMDGLDAMTGDLLSKAQQIADSIRATIQSALAIHSPSRVMVWMGEMLGAGMIKGMDSSLSGIRKVSSKLANAALPNIPNVNVPSLSISGIQASSSSYAGNGGTSYGDIYVTIPAKDIQEFNTVVAFFNRLNQAARAR